MKTISILAMLAALWLSGCATQTFEPGKEPAYMVSGDFAKFYLAGPAQERGPDATLRTGEIFKLLRREMGYSYIQLEDGRSGYIANEEMEPAPEPVPEPQAKRSPKKKGASREEDFAEIDPGQMPDLSVLPEAVEVFHPVEELDLPADAKPQFRY
jgi:hypothetical protein